MTIRFFRLAFAIGFSALSAQQGVAQDLTGIWRNDKGGRYVFRQAGENFCWSFETNNVFCGLVIGKMIAGRWLDLPTGQMRGQGELLLRIISNDRVEKVNESTSYNGSVWTREGSSEPPPATPTPTPQPAPAPQPPPPATVPSSPQPSGGPRPAPADLNGGTKDWTYRALDAEYRSMTGKLIDFSCSAYTAPTVWRALYGTDVYTDDSVLCEAAVHAGVITTQGGTFTIEIRPGQSSYAGSSRNGVISANYAQWGGSFAFRQVQVTYDAGAPRPPSVPSPVCPLAGTWAFDAPALGSSSLSIDSSGGTRESGMGNSTGTTVLNGRTLRYTWTTVYGYDGIVVINLNESCKEGRGTVTWTKYPPTEKRGTSFPATLMRRN